MGLLLASFRTPAVILADGIDFSLLLVYGVIVLVPLMLFQVAVEGGILSRLWGIPFKQLARIVFVANCWSLIAGIPTRLLNAWLYDALLPNDLVGYFKYYPAIAGVGTFIYLVITIFVEALYLFRRVREAKICRSKLWRGVILANLATYAVLAPLNYWGTRPFQNVREYLDNTSWAAKPASQILYIDSKSGQLKSILSDGSSARTLVSSQVTNYVVASNLQAIVFQDRAGVQRTYRLATSQIEQTNADLQLTKSLNSQNHDQIAWQVSDETGERRAWAEPGLGNNLYVYRTNHDRGDSVRVAVNPGLLHLPNFRFYFGHPAFISGGHECLFQSGEFIYLLDIEKRRVGKLAHGRNFAILPEGKIE